MASCLAAVGSDVEMGRLPGSYIKPRVSRDSTFEALASGSTAAGRAALTWRRFTVGGCADVV